MKSQRTKTTTVSRPWSKPKTAAASRSPLILVQKRPIGAKKNSLRQRTAVIYILLIAAAAIVVAMLYAAAPVHADTPPAVDPMSTVKGVMNQTIAVFQDRDISPVNRRQKLRTIAEAHFDFSGMARSAVGFQWRTFTDDQRKEFVPLFTTFIEDVALSQIEKYSVEKVQQDIKSSVIDFNREQVDGDRAEVFSTVTLQSRADPLQVTYVMKSVGGDWRIYDIDVDNISVISNYRNQFNRVLNEQGYDKLVSLLRAKAEQLGTTLAN